MLFFWAETQFAWIFFRFGTQGTTGTWCTIAVTKPHMDGLLIMPIMGLYPFATVASLRACYCLVLPIDGKAGSIIAFSFSHLPMDILSNRSNESHVMFSLTAYQQIGVHIPGINQMVIWKQGFFCKGSVNRCGHFAIWNGGNRRFYIRDHMDLVLLAGFCQMNLVARPSRCSLVARVSFWIVGRILAQAGRR